MARICEITGVHTRTGNSVSHAHNINKRKFYPNLQAKRFYLEEIDLWLHLRLSTAAIRTIERQGLMATLKKAYTKGTLAPSLHKLVGLLY